MLQCFLFQSTLPRRERPAQADKQNKWNAVSIHAPTKGATGISIIIFFSNACFNPRSHEGSDDNIIEISKNQYVSIHAPTKGATPAHTALRTLKTGFNPRSHEGSDQKNVLLKWKIYLFQSTLPRRERPTAMPISQPCSVFQSTLPRRERHQPSHNRRFGA